MGVQAIDTLEFHGTTERSPWQSRIFCLLGRYRPQNAILLRQTSADIAGKGLANGAEVGFGSVLASTGEVTHGATGGFEAIQHLLL
jgi:hypothetical protein